MKNLVYILLFLVSGCATLFYMNATLADKRDNKLTLKYFVGKKPDWYTSAFESTANDLCPKKGYDIVEKTYQPTTLTVWDDGFYYWVIKCK